MLNIKNFISRFVPVLSLFFLLISCFPDDSKSNTSKSSSSKILRFATAAEYPPFEYKVEGRLVGFDIELARLIAKRLGKKARFQDMQFSAILPAVQSEMVDAAISTITITEERRHNFDFSIPYHTDSMAMLFLKKYPISKDQSLEGKKIASQVGTTMENWLRNRPEKIQIIQTDSNLKNVVESLKLKEVDAILVDILQASFFTEKNPEIDYTVFEMSEAGYGIVLRKDSELTGQVNLAIKTLEERGTIRELKRKYKINR